MSQLQTIDLLERKIKEANHGKSVEVETSLLQTSLKAIVDLSSQLEQLQEQQRFKPSVAVKLNETIKKLEYELEVNQNVNKVKELERKVARLELDLKSSYSTRNFTLKQGLLDLEKKYRNHIYSHPDVQELWTEVMFMLVEDKDKEKALAEGLANAAALRRQKQQRKQAGQPESPGDTTPACSTPGAVHKAVDQIQEAHGKDTPAPVNYPNYSRPLSIASGRHQRTASNASMYSNWSHMAAEEVAQKAPQEVAASLTAFRDMFGVGGPVQPAQSQGSAAGKAGPVQSFQLNLTAMEELETLQLDVEKLLELWKQRVATAPGEIGEFLHGTGAVFAATGAAGGKLTASPGGSQRDGVTGKVDAAFLEQQAEAALASLAQLREKFMKEGGPVLPGQPAGQSSGGSGAAVADVSIFDKQAEHLAASINQLRTLWSKDSPGPKGLPPLPGRSQGALTAGALAAADTSRSDDLRKFLLGPAGPAPQVSHKDMLTHFIDFLKTKGIDASGAATPESMEALVSQFSAHLQEAGLGKEAAAVLAPNPEDVISGALWSNKSLGASFSTTGDVAASFLPLLPALRLSTAATKATPGVSAKELLNAVALNDAAPTWWASSLEAAAQGGNAAVATGDAQGAAADPAGGAQGEGTAPAASSTGSGTAGAEQGATAAAQGGPAAGAVGAGLAPIKTSSASGDAAPGVPFDPLLLPGPVRTMQAVMAHVRSRHSDFLKSCPEAEALLSEALQASAELQQAQDRSLIRMAVTRTRAARTPTGGQTPKSRLSPMGSGATNVVLTADAATNKQGDAAAPLKSYGSEQQFEFPGVAGGSDSTGMLAQPANVSEIQPAEGQEGGQGVNMEDVEAVPMSVEDYATELEEVRAIATRHAEHAAALQELLVRLASQHALATENADDLEVRVQLSERENALLREEVDNLTQLLIETKVSNAEWETENQKLQQRLKKSIASEAQVRNEIQELKRHLAVLGLTAELPQEVSASYGNAISAAMDELDAEQGGSPSGAYHPTQGVAQALAEGKAALAELEAEGVVTQRLTPRVSAAAPVLPEHEAHTQATQQAEGGSGLQVDVPGSQGAEVDATKNLGNRW